ncbi:family 2 glycosyl transferase [Pseudoclavibacter sp. RFBG4]|uniref:glycosyltransferase family 2 protein n=1 Tax=Pseudoclavibacter sp. RFBG4 TaxID=2080575 RepID=UPI000CE84FE5|nr:glycosyltransferase [Pseudoclavibacter sp. RFBG4]PPG35822.1 family 2 glycosyl transferase [Pseudoclavibacter sp. RFBG4]
MNWVLASRAVAGIALAYLGARSVVLLANLLTQPNLRSGAPARQPATRVSLLIPARDEEATLRETLPGFLGQGADEVVVLDDESSDATRAISESAGARVLGGAPRPDGWTGKNWSCAQLAEAVAPAPAPAPFPGRVAAAPAGRASQCPTSVQNPPAAPASGREHSESHRSWSGDPEEAEAEAEADAGADAVARHPSDVLVFTDADVRWSPGALDALLATMRVSRAELLTVFPRQETRTLGERLITPLNDAVVLGSVPVALQHRRAPVVANGQVMAFTRAAYDRIGGHAAVSGELVEDMRLAERMRAAGGRVVVARGGTAIAVRMYDGYGSSVRGFAKSLLGLHHGSRALMAATSLLTVCVYTLPWVLRVWPGAHASAGRGATARILHLVRIAGLLDRTLVSVITGRRRPLDLAEGILGPISPLLVLPVYALAGRRRVAWKGRVYEA